MEGFSLAAEAKLTLVRALLDDTIDKLEIVSHLNAVVKEDASNDDGSIASILEDRTRTERAYARKMEQRQKSIGRSRKKVLEEREAVKELIQQMGHLDIQLQHKLRSEKATNIIALNRIKKEKNRALQVLIQTARDLQELAECPTLFGIIQDERAKETKYEEMLKRVKASHNTVDQIEEEISVENKGRQREENDRKERIKSLKQQLARLRHEFSITEEIKGKESKAMVHTFKRLRAQEEKNVMRELENAQIQLDREKKAKELVKSYLERKIDQTDAQIVEWTQRYHDDMGQLTNVYRDLASQREMDLEMLKSSEEAYVREQAASSIRIEEERHRVELQRLRNEAAIIIQSNYRGFVTRIKLKREKLAKKKKGKGKKGAKEKK